jgi:hypothetical protein
VTDEVENLILEHLKRFQSGQERIERDLRDMKFRIGQLDASVAAIRADQAHASGDLAHRQLAFDSLADRVDRIEKRLELI